MASESTGGPGVRGASIALRNITKVFETDDAPVVAVDGVDLEIAPGELLVLLGPSGCGKTTLLCMVGGLETATSGELSFDAHLAGAAGSKPGVSIAFQDPRLFPWMSVLENVALPLRLQGVSASECDAKARDLCKLVGIAGFEDASPNALSGGMKQRASIARALSIDPSTLLLDEPFGVLDAMTRDQMNLELQRIWLSAGATIILVTHSINEAVFLGDRIILLSPRPGRIHKTYVSPFKRPRDIDVQSTPAFQEIVRDIRHELNGFSRHDDE